jgi:hypothetical protein
MRNPTLYPHKTAGKKADAMPRHEDFGHDRQTV